MNPFREFLAEQGGRLALRVWVLLHGIAAAVFWALFFICWTGLVHVGLAWVGWALVGVYLVVAAPFLILQAVMVTDLLAYVVIGQTFAFGTIDEIVEKFARANPARLQTIPWRLHLLFFFADVSPISSIAIWSLVVLKRMPTEAHKKVRVQDLRRQEIALERAVYATATARLRLSAS